MSDFIGFFLTLENIINPRSFLYRVDVFIVGKFWVSQRAFLKLTLGTAQLVELEGGTFS